MEDKASGRLLTEGKSVQVMYDYKQKKTMPLEQKMRDAVASLEQLSLNELSSSEGRM
jgi:acyl-CoA thioesterase FadM